MTIIRTKTAMTILFSLFALQTIGCASITNSYDRYERVPGELNWSFDDALQLEKNGRLVAEAGDWSGLDKAVACVPKAGKFAKRATSQAAIGTFLTYGGAATMAVSGAYALSTDFDQAVYGAAGLIGGLTGVLTGLLFQAASTPNAVDAVNCYNDHYDSQNGCQ